MRTKGWVAFRRFEDLNRFFRSHARWFFWAAVAGVLAKLTHEVLEQEPIPFDPSILWFLHKSVPNSVVQLFEMITLTGSSKWLCVLVVGIALWLWIRRYRTEAVQLSLSLAMAGLVIYLAKTAVDRARPALWETETYWGSSFPSGHTLGAAAVATALWLAVSRCAPRYITLASLLLTAWVFMVGLSRLVLGVHWPTDVAAAACAGILVAVAANGLVLRGRLSAGFA